jgi:hypothetical protein
MNRDDLIKMFVLNEIGDDYESFEKISNETAALGQRLRLYVDPSEISNALTDLIKSGLARAYHLSPWHPAKEVEAPISNQYPDLYFLVTRKGADEHKRLESRWPFDDKGQPRAGTISESAS